MPEITVFGAYVAAALLMAGPGRRTPASVWTTAAPLLAVLAVASHAALLWHAVLSNGPTNLSLGNTVSLSGWMLSLLISGYFFNSTYRGLAAIFLVAISVSVMFTGSAGSHVGVVGTEPAWQFASHAVMATLSYSLLAVAAALAVMTSLKDRQLRRGPDVGWTRLLPPLDELERHMYMAIVVGFVLLSLAIFSGLIFVQDVMAQHLVHKTVLTGLAWLIFGILILGRWQFGWRGRKAINLTLAGFAVLVLAYFGSRVVLEMLLGRYWG
ncbi:MAG: cytochrome c biogenesis protein CcsA [Gammaproteobacteria bacterium]|nr:cytochrome c biogenesis protein CcsA [Gammaproteobacteria bacterium]NNF66565.1 cytochrome c biogenesis protein CcsA [Gammaproteobacteria bacterium]